MKKLEPWQQGESMFAYIQQHIDESGFFTENSLPDKGIAVTDSVTSLELGATDAYLSTTQDLVEHPMGVRLYKKLQDYISNSTEENAIALYFDVCSTPCIVYHESLIDKLEKQRIPTELKALTLKWLYQSSHREAIKFSIIMAGLILLNPATEEEGEKLKEALLLLAKCEEFTCYVLFSLDLSNTMDKKDVWDIMQHTNGWGKISAMEEYVFTTTEEKEWLQCHGCQLSVSYPSIALLVLKYVDVLEVLKQPAISHSVYRGMQAMVHNYLLFLLNHEDEEHDDFADEEELPALSVYLVIDKLLEHSKKVASTLEDLAGLINLSEVLTVFAENSLWQHFSSNQCHLLLSATEQLIFQKKWEPLIIEQLITKGEAVNELAAGLAMVLNLNVRPQLLKLLKKHPQQTGLYLFLLQTNNMRSFNSVLKFAKEHLKEYTATEEPLKPILTALAHTSGEGADIVAAGLTSIYDGTRAYALSTLENWAPEAVTPELKVALIKARNMCQHPLLSMRIELLLMRKSGDLDNFMDYLNSLK